MSRSVNIIIVALLSFIFIAANAVLALNDNFFINALPIAFVIIYAALVVPDKLLLFVAFAAPLSFNIEELHLGQIGLFIPTEPILFGLLIVIIWNELIRSQIDSKIYRHPLTVLFFIQFVWLILTSIMSEYPLVSFKYTLVRIWFIVPVFIWGIMLFKNKRFRFQYIWLYIIGLTIVVLYTLIHHASNGFSEEAGHWVMSPFFKDHTSYGAILALFFPLLFSLYKIHGKSLLVQIFIVGLIGLFAVALFYSYTRAAWLSVVGALGVYFLIKIGMGIRTFLTILGIGIIMIISSWTQIEIMLEKNDSEHATENIEERIESMTNVTTDASNLERLNRWSAAYSMFEERPIVGWGPGTYAFVYAPFQRSENITLISTNFGDLGNAHSEYLGPLSEQGLLGMIIMIAIVSVLFYRSIRTYKLLPAGTEKTLAMGLILGLVTYFLHAFLNNYLDTDKASIPVWGFAAILICMELYSLPKSEDKT